MKRAFFCVILVLFCLPAAAQQTDINKYTLYTGFDSMISPARSLTEYGFDVDFGVTVKPWLALGGDFSAIGDSIISGSGTIKGGETVYAPLLIGVGVAPNSVHVPFKSTSYTFAAGPQFYLRKWKEITLFARPGFGGMHESANLTLPPGLDGLLGQAGIPIPNSHQSDTTWFVGVGGGIDQTVEGVVSPISGLPNPWFFEHPLYDRPVDRFLH